MMQGRESKSNGGESNQAAVSDSCRHTNSVLWWLSSVHLHSLQSTFQCQPPLPGLFLRDSASSQSNSPTQSPGQGLLIL